eukprot:166133_1
MSTVYLRLFALFLVLIVTNSRQQSQTRYWRGGNDEGTWNVPMNGGVVKTEEWDDGQPQTLSFSMKVPDAIFNQWGHKKTYPYTYHAFVATGQVLCAMHDPTYEQLQKLLETNGDDIRPLHPGPDQNRRQYVGPGGLQSYSKFVDGLEDRVAIETQYEYQQACVMITCRSPPRTYGSRVKHGQQYCPINPVFSWRKSRSRTDVQSLIKPADTNARA